MKRLGAIALAIVFLFTAIFAVISIERIRPGYVGVVYNISGGIENTVLTQGWKLVAPWKHVTQYPVSTETVYFSSKSDEGEGDKDDTSINSGTADGKNLNMDVSYTYHYDPIKLPAVYTKFRGQSADVIANTYIRKALKDSLNAVTCTYNIFDIYGTKRTEVATLTYEKFRKMLEPDGIIIESFSITEVNPDEQTKAAIQKTVEAIQEKARMEVEKQKAEIEKQTAVIKAERDKEVAIKQAEAEAATITAKANAQAEANMKVNASLTPQLIEYERVKKWSGNYPDVVAGQGADLLLDARTE